MNDDLFDERRYNTDLLAGNELSIRRAADGFAVFGFRKNRDLLTAIAATRLSYTGERSFSALRCAHSSRHLSPFLEGRHTWLPLLHTTALFRFYGRREEQEFRGGSLTSSQLSFELLEAFSRGEWTRAAGIAKEMAVRGENENLLIALRSEALRRHSSSSNAYNVWNAVRCVASDDPDILPEAAVTAVTALSNEDLSGSYFASRKLISDERLDTERLVDEDGELDEREEGNLIGAIRSGFTELSMQLIGRQLKHGVALLPLLRRVSVEALRQSFNSQRKELIDGHIAFIGSISEANRKADMVSSFTPHELIILCLETTALACERRFRRKKEKEVSLEEAVSLMEKGRVADMLSHIEGARNMQEAGKVLKMIALSSLRCDPEAVNDNPLIHCTASIYTGTAESSLSDLKAALQDCADFIAVSRKGKKSCGQTIMRVLEKEKGESEYR